MGRQKKNPAVYQHPDMFVGQSPVRVAIEDLTDTQLKSLPRSAYTDEEWEELDVDVAEHIYHHDKESASRVEALTAQLREVTEHLVDLDTEFAIPEAESGIDEALADTENLLERSRKSGDYESLRSEFPEGDEWTESFEEALKEVLSDWNMYEFDVDRYNQGYGWPSSCLIYVPVYNSIYIEWDRMLTDPEKIYRDEVERAIDELDRGAMDYFEVDEVYESLQAPPQKTRGSLHGDTYKPPFEKHFDYVAAVCGRLEEGKALEELKELIDEPEDEGPAWIATPPEDRVIHRFDDGFYVQRLTPDELPDEGRKQRMCVGRDDMGYMDGVRDGEIWILSLRTPAGRPKLTFEVELDDDVPKNVSQIKGKANRLPGWDLGKAPPVGSPDLLEHSYYKMKADEVAKAIVVVDVLGLKPADVYDLGPALMHLGHTDTKYEQIAELMHLLIGPSRPNPMRQPRRKSFEAIQWTRAKGTARTFDKPYRRKR